MKALVDIERKALTVYAVFVQKNNIDDQSEGDTYDKSYMSGCMEVLCFIHVTILSPPPSPGLLIFCVSARPGKPVTTIKCCCSASSHSIVRGGGWLQTGCCYISTTNPPGTTTNHSRPGSVWTNQRASLLGNI